MQRVRYTKRLRRACYTKPRPICVNAMVLTHPSSFSRPPAPELWSNELPLESDRHLHQILLLLASLGWWWRDRPDAPNGGRNDFFMAGNLTIYFNPAQLKTQDFRGPDFFVVLDTNDRERKSWVVWQEDYKFPNLIVELLSDSTANVDRVDKKKIYQNDFKTPEYFWFDPYTLEFRGFRLQASGQYQAIAKAARGWCWSEQLQLYLGIAEKKLRFFTPEGELVPAPAEAAIAERQRAEAAYLQLRQAEARTREERQRAEQERLRAEQEWLRAEQERLRAEAAETRELAERDRAQQERQRAEQGQQRAEQERQRAEQERQRAEAAEAREASARARVEQLLAQLNTLGIKPEIDED